METKNIVLFGATTKAGERILNEALSRGHKVTAITPNPEKITKSHPHLTKLEGDIMNKNDIRSKLKGHDVVISAYNIKTDPQEHYKGSANLIEVAKADNVRQLIIMGHPGVDELEPTMPMPANNQGWKAISEIQRKTLEALENEKDFRWSYVHQPAINDIEDKPRPSTKILIKSTESEQYFPVRDSYKAVVDEAEHFTEAHTEL